MTSAGGRPWAGASAALCMALTPRPRGSGSQRRPQIVSAAPPPLPAPPQTPAPSLRSAAPAPVAAVISRAGRCHQDVRGLRACGLGPTLIIHSRSYLFVQWNLSSTYSLGAAGRLAVNRTGARSAPRSFQTVAEVLLWQRIGHTEGEAGVGENAGRGGPGWGQGHGRKLWEEERAGKREEEHPEGPRPRPRAGRVGDSRALKETGDRRAAKGTRAQAGSGRVGAGGHSTAFLGVI